MKSTFETIKEEVEDIIVEAKMDRMQKQFEKELSYVEDDYAEEQEVIEAAARLRKRRK